MATEAAPSRRARTMEELAVVGARHFPPQEIERAIRSYRPLANDVIISPSAKCGTTWLQQTFHTLRTGGDMDFDDISRVVPWIETAHMLGLDINAPQRAQPRGFKSHLSYDRIPKGARYVVSLRDPRDALVSMHQFMEAWYMEPGAVSITDYAKGWLVERADGLGYWNHLLSWWGQRDNPDVLLVSYEHMSAAPADHIRYLAAFCDLPLDEALLDLTLERSSRAFMLTHKNRFDDAMLRRLARDKGIPESADTAKVRKRTGGHRGELTPEIEAAVDALWTRVITPKLGFPDYATLEAKLRGRQA